jgi:hypothetical protein
MCTLAVLACATLAAAANPGAAEAAPGGASVTTAPPAQEASADWQLEVLPAPSFGRTPARAPVRPTSPPRLTQVSVARNSITDERQWFTRNSLSLPLYEMPGVVGSEFGPPAEPLPRFVPHAYRGNSLVMALRQQRGFIAVYGEYLSSGRYLVALDSSGRFRYGFDFGRYAYAPGGAPRNRDLVYQGIRWAIEADGTLYVQHSHATYARSSGGMNAYLTAIDTRDGRVLWRSAPLVANASNFEVVGDRIITGYGFTNEPDYLFLLDRRTGEARQRLPVRSGPSYIVRRGERVHVRAYDADYVFRLAAR